MQVLATRKISGEVFSAKLFFEQRAQGREVCDGRSHFEVELPGRGLQVLSVQSDPAVWIEGVYADSALQEQFINALRSGDIPRPLPEHPKRSVHSHIVYIAPEHLVSSPRTIVAVCGAAPALQDLALSSRLATCARCGALIDRHTAPSDLLATIARDWQGVPGALTISAESAEAGFAEWASSQGLRLNTSQSGSISVFLDQFECGTDPSPSLGRLLHPLWRIPKTHFVCVASSGTSRTYTPAGWCTACGSGGDGIARSKVTSLLAQGLGSQERSVSEAFLTTPEGYSLKQILTLSLRELTLLPTSPLTGVRSLLLSLDLGHLSFGSCTDTLSARDLARVSIAATILEATQGNDCHILVSLPRAILGGVESNSPVKVLTQAANERGVSVIGAPFDTVPATNHAQPTQLSRGPCLVSLLLPAANDENEVQIHAGDYLQLSQQEHALGRSLSALKESLLAQLKRHATPPPTLFIPVFESSSTNTRVVGDVVGLLEPLSRLYAASLDARMHGLQAKDFTLFGTRSPRYVCGECRGLGLILTHRAGLPRPLAAPCTSCGGARCKAPVSSALFRGVAFSTILNQTVGASSGTLAALSGAKKVLTLLSTLDLEHLPLGMPLAVLSGSELRRLRLVQALLLGKQSKPCIVVLEEPAVGLEDRHLGTVRQLRDAALAGASLAWIELSN